MWRNLSSNKGKKDGEEKRKDQDQPSTSCQLVHLGDEKHLEVKIERTTEEQAPEEDLEARIGKNFEIFLIAYR